MASYSTMEGSEPWCFTVVRSNGLRLMRPEKSWRPIVTVEVDKHHCHETVLGVDGQNPNLKETFYLHQVHMDSQVDIRVWHRSQSKKKAKKRSLVASASHSLRELLKKQEMEPHSKLEVRLQCQSASKRAISSRGKPQNGATLLLKIRPPPTVERPLPEPIASSSGSGYSSDSGSSAQGLDSIPPSPTDDCWPDEDTLTDATKPNLRRRRRLRGYAIDSEDEVYSTDDDGAYDDEKPFVDDNSYHDDDEEQDPCFDDLAAIRPQKGSDAWYYSIMPSMLPQYTETINVPSDMTWAERALSSFTMYSEMKAATLDSHFEQVFSRLQTEWTYVGGLLVALAAVSTAVFAISTDSMFVVQSYARIAIAASSVASGLGIACDAWFLLRYNWADLHTFINRARDLYSSYFFFCLSARVPALCLFVSALSLMAFLGLVAFEVWPLGVLVTCFIVGLVMTLQFLVFGAHWCVMRVIGAVKWVWRGARRLSGSGVTEDGGGKAAKEKAGKIKEGR
ncbi:hypothetical protein Hypma_008469 [Hypsizygus marmoreus]|uniref:C2 domain-containing protein n=1 Tax=Hypsizygus marmoreus TaxID=39966 RepID=A0A369JVM8_HYPMA|nr:hypothetical protein Hypma_008469 [Hypsizygus marmoreus]